MTNEEIEQWLKDQDRDYYETPQETTMTATQPRTYRTHSVTFYSPGTFVGESSNKPIAHWDVHEAMAMSKTIQERYNARPHSFRFQTWLESDPIPDGEGGTLEVVGKKDAESPLYFMGGKLRTYDEVLARNDPTERILLSNMRCNSMCVVIENTNSYRYTGVFDEDCILLDEQGQIIRRGNDPDLVEYRKAFKARMEQERDAMLKGGDLR